MFDFSVNLTNSEKREWEMAIYIYSITYSLELLWQPRDKIYFNPFNFCICVWMWMCTYACVSDVCM